MNKLTKFISGATLAVASALPMSSANAALIIGGDATSQATATSIVDIVFAIDTSGSMVDDIASIALKAQETIENLSCPTTDCYVRARFFANVGPSGSVFNESAYDYVNARNGAALPIFNDTEDNGLVVSDLINFYDWNNDAVAGQSYYRAIVSIGDEGMINGSPVQADDYLAAYNANQAAAAAGILLFGWVADDPVTAAVGPLFQAFATGGSLGGYNFSDTGGGYIFGPLTDVTVSQQLAEIICQTATGGGPTGVPEPVSLGLLGMGLMGLGFVRRKKAA